MNRSPLHVLLGSPYRGVLTIRTPDGERAPLDGATARIRITRHVSSATALLDVPVEVAEATSQVVIQLSGTQTGAISVPVPDIRLVPLVIRGTQHWLQGMEGHAVVTLTRGGETWPVSLGPARLVLGGLP